MFDSWLFLMFLTLCTSTCQFKSNDPVIQQSAVQWCAITSHHILFVIYNPT